MPKFILNQKKKEVFKLARVNTRKRGERWEYRFEGAKIGGERKQISKSGFRTQADALKAGNIALVEYENAGLNFEPSETSVADYMDYWMENYVKINCRYNTQNNYEQHIRNHIKPTLGMYKLKSLTPTILQKFINKKYLSGMSKNHLTNLITVLSGSLKYAVHPLKYIKENPMQYVKYPKYEHTKEDANHKLITNKEFNKIIDRFPVESNFYIPLMIGYYTGCRIGEVMGLTWEDVDLNQKTININKIIYKRPPSWYFGSTKTQSSVRNIKIGETLVNTLKRHKKWQAENRLKYGQHYTQQYDVIELDGNKKLRRIYSLSISTPFVGTSINFICTKENGEMITPDSFKYASRVINYELGIMFNFHSLRHTHATTLIENGAEPKDVQERLGHSNLATTMDTYTHVTEKMTNRTVEIFEKASLPTK